MIRIRYRLFLVVLFSALVTLRPVAHAGQLPLGDGKISEAPQAGSIFSCQHQFGQGGTGEAGNWIHGTIWDSDAKPFVAGQIPWPQAMMTITVENGERIIRSNGLPDHPTGVFPIQPSDPAYRFDRNPNSIQAQNITLRLPAEPQLTAQPACVPMGMIGIALTGAAIFNGLDGGGRDAAAHEVQDACRGHPERRGQYHYHSASPCMRDENGRRGATSGLIGYALDGFGIYGEYDESGRLLTNADLDDCHGRVSPVVWNGRRQSIYHYQLTEEYPYTIGCFRGTPVTTSLTGQRDAINQRPPPMQGPGGRGPEILERAAQELGIDPARLRDAVGPPPPDFSSAAQKLGIDEARLRDAFARARAEIEGEQ